MLAALGAQQLQLHHLRRLLRLEHAAVVVDVDDDGTSRSDALARPQPAAGAAPTPPAMCGTHGVAQDAGLLPAREQLPSLFTGGCSEKIYTQAPLRTHTDTE
eukprot:2466448-Prymnesium_polylepis.2